MGGSRVRWCVSRSWYVLVVGLGLGLGLGLAVVLKGKWGLEMCYTRSLLMHLIVNIRQMSPIVMVIR